MKENLDRKKQQQKCNKMKILTPKFKERKVKATAFSFPWCPYICECLWKKTQIEKKLKAMTGPSFCFIQKMVNWAVLGSHNYLIQ